MTRKKIYFLFLISVFLLQVLAMGDHQLIQPQSTLSPLNITNNNEENGDIVDNFNSNSPIQSDVMSWWNESYDYRQRVEVTNPLAFTQTRPVEFDISFDDGKANPDSIRLVKYDTETSTWTPIPCQVWNTTISTTFVTYATITFIGQDLAPGTSIYYVYYDPDETYDPTDYSSNTFTTALSGNALSVDWDDIYGNSYKLRLDQNYGAYQLNDTYGINRHTGNSTAPGVIGIDDDLIAYWDFDKDDFEEKTDRVVPDGSGVGYVVHDGVYYDTGVSGDAAWFDGASDYVSINADQTKIGGLTNDITLMAWVNLQGSGERIIASWDRSEYWRFAIDAYNKVYFATALSASAIDDMHGTIAIPVDGTWHHVAVSYDHTTGTKKIYVDGVLDSEKIASHGAGYLGISSGRTRYGFIGTGSESSTFDGTTGPDYWYDGGLDELRFYSKALSQDEIIKAMNQAVKVSDIDNITEILNGKVMSKYEVNWKPINMTTTLTMTVSDVWTFYRSLNMYQVSRTFVWNDRVKNPQFAAFNTLFNYDPSDANPTTKDYYYYDNNLVAGHDSTDFTSHNYTVVHDYDGDNNYIALGLFLTDKSVSLPYVPGMQFNDCSWKVTVNSNQNQINFIPGNQTTLDTISSGPLYNVSMTFWEYIQDDFVQTPTGALAYFDNLYKSLTNEIPVSLSPEQEVFYNLEVLVLDHDGNPVPNVNVDLINTTDLSVLNTTGITDSNGLFTYYELVSGNYSVNLTYDPYPESNGLWLGLYSYTVNSSLTNSLNTEQVSITVNMSSIVISFISREDGSPLNGATISFLENSSGAFSDIGTETTDSNGNVTLHWANYSATTVINFTCYFLGNNYLISLDNSSYSTNQVHNITELTYLIVYVNIGDFEGILNLTDSSPSHVYGEPLTFDILYAFNVSGTVTNIPGATVTYVLQYHGVDITSGLFNPTDAQGESSNIIDYITNGIPLQTGYSYTLRVTATKEGYTPMTETLNFELEEIATTFTLSSQFESNIYWDRNITFSFYYYDEYNSAGITGANITYSLVDDPNINGTLTADSTLGNGWYTVELNSTDFGSTGTYTMSFSASKANYVGHSSTLVQFSILDILTNLTTNEDAIEVYWNENFSLSVEFNDELLNIGINTAQVKWTLVGNSLITGNLTHATSDSDGYYSADINSTVFSYAGRYNIQIVATLPNYETQVIYVSLNVKEIYTLLNDKTTPIINVQLYRTEKQIFEFNYTSRAIDASGEHFIPVINATYQTYEWQNVDNSSEQGTGTLVFDPETNLYKLDFQTETRAIGSYTITVRIQEINYITRVAVVYLDILPREFSINLATSVANGEYDSEAEILQYTVNQDDIFNITLNIGETLNNEKMNNATVVYIDSDGNQRTFYNIGEGIYTLEMVADANAFYQQQIMEGKIVISATDFDNVTINTQILVQMPEIIDGVPTFYFVLGVSAVAIIVVSLGVNKAIQKARIPAFVKLIDKVSKEIKSKKEISANPVSVSYEEEIIEKFSNVWQMLDLNLSEILKSDSIESSGNLAPGDMGGL